MSKNKEKELATIEKQIFDAVANNDLVLLQTVLSEKPNVNILDENLMTPLQHAAYKGYKDIVQMLIDQGADVNLCKHQHNYTALHFAGLSGNIDVCVALLLAGAKTNVANTVNRTPAQMAAFVGHHNCVAMMNNFVPISDVEYYTIPRGEKEYLPPYLAESFHKLLTQINLHPVKIALNVQNLIGITDHLEEVKNVLDIMSSKEMKKGSENNEVLSFKFHYLSYIINEIIKIRQRQVKSNNGDHDKKLDVTELYTRKMLKPNKDGFLEFMDNILRECVREFSYRECTLFRQMVSTLASKDSPSAISVIMAAINGQRGFVDNIPMCHTCGEEKPSKKCSKCKIVQYCDRNCQRLHWHWHKKTCARLMQGGGGGGGGGTGDYENKDAPDPQELSSELQNLLVSN